MYCFYHKNGNIPVISLRKLVDFFDENKTLYISVQNYFSEKNNFTGSEIY